MGYENSLTLEDIFVTEKYKPTTYTDVKVKNDPLKDQIQTVLEANGWKIKISNYSIHPSNNNIILVTYNQKPIYRRSFQSNALLLNLATAEVNSFNDEMLRLVMFSPDGNYISYEKQNDIYLYHINTATQTRITKSGLYNHIINGHTDWVYEEEFGFTKAYYWNQNATKIAYLKFDESSVKEYDMTLYEYNYNRNYSYKYPKVGEANSKVSVHVYDLHDSSTLEISSQISFEYIPKVMWVNDLDKLLIFTLNRLQNQLTIYLYDFETRQMDMIYEEMGNTYLDFYGESYFVDNNTLYFYSDASGFKNIYSLDLENYIIKQVTNFEFDIEETIDIDKNNNWLYLTATYPSPMDRNIIAINYSTSKVQNLTNENGFYEVFINKETGSWILQFSDLNSLPEAWNCQLLFNEDEIPYLSKIDKIVTNEDLQIQLNNLNLPTPEFISIENPNKIGINGWILKPNDFSEEEKYPLLICNYGGPGSQMVLNKYGTVNYWHKYMAQKGFIVACFDNIGTGGRGADFRKATYKMLGKLEIEDQIYIAKEFANYNYIDATKIVHWGWSFGGFMSLLAITKGADIFTHSIAIAPVTNWRWYDSIYTERYMQTPDVNETGYEENRPFNYIDNMKGKLLLIHGSADDNVHVQHSLLFSEALIQKDKSFEMFIYPNKNHRITGGNTTLHLWKKITAWLEQLL